MKTDIRIVKQLEGFVNKIQLETNKYYAQHLANLTPPVINVEEGSKFWKIITEGTQKCVYCFVSKSNGDIYKAASWKAPAKHVCGNIFDANFSFGKGVNMYGGTYLR
jgi:hypothetical protein